MTPVKTPCHNRWGGSYGKGYSTATGEGGQSHSFKNRELEAFYRMLEGHRFPTPDQLDHEYLRALKWRETPQPPSGPPKGDQKSCRQEVSKRSPKQKRGGKTKQPLGHELILGELRRHHKYRDGGVLNPEPLEVKTLVKQLDGKDGCSKPSVSRWFKGHFTGGWAGYKIHCRNGKIGIDLQSLSGELSPRTIDALAKERDQAPSEN